MKISSESKDEGSTKLDDLKPENRKRRKEPPKPWGKRERYVVLAVLLVTVLTAASLAMGARDFKLPGLPKFKFDLKNPFGEETVIIGNKASRGEKIKRGFEEKTRNLSGTYALYVMDLTSGETFGVNENEIMQAASLIKLPVMALVYEENLENKYGDSVEAMGKRSDNAAFSKLVAFFGKNKIQNYIDSLGMVNTSLEENETTPKEIGEFFKRFKDAPFAEFMTGTIYEDWLTRGVPEGVKVVHKYGREVHVVSDAGIVYAPKPYIIVIMTQGVVEKEADEVFPELSRLVYDGMN